MKLNIIPTVRFIVPSRCFLLLPSLQDRFNCQGYYTPCKNKETKFGKKSNSECFEGWKSNTENYNNNERF